MILPLLLLLLLSLPAHSFPPCNTTLTLRPIPTQSGSATCADGTPAYYYYRPADVSSTKFVIWLGEGELCGTNERCGEIMNRTQSNPSELCATGSEGNDKQVTSGLTFSDSQYDRGRCFSALLTFTSSWVVGNYSQIKGETLLCGNDEHFKDYNMVYAPSCTLDWWMGDGPDDLAVGDSRWRGSRVLDSMIQDMVSLGISSASRVVFGGSGGGGVGVLNNIRRIRALPALAPVFNVMSIVDSSFLVNVQRFANLSTVFMGVDENAFKIDQLLEQGVAAWRGRAKVDADCAAYWDGKTHKCAYIGEVLRRTEVGDERVMVIQSQYDLLSMSQLDLLNQSLSKSYADNASYAQNAVSFIETFGSELRTGIEQAAYVKGSADNIYVFSPACGQYGYIVPTELHRVSPTVAEMGRAGQLSYRRDAYVWNTVSIGGLSVRAAIVAWLSGNGNTIPALPSMTQRHNVRADRCGTFLCNPTCSNSVNPFALTTIWGPCSQRLVYAYCLIMLGSWWLLFIIASVAMLLFRKKTRSYWEQVSREEDEVRKRDGPNEAEQHFRNQAEEELIRDAFASSRRVHIMVRNLSYWAAPRKSGRSFQILRSVSATFAAGNVHALMGPSGSGKSTMLDLVALTRDSGILTGNHYVNGVETYSKVAGFLREWLKHNVSYVKQADNMFPLLTVREHLTHAAWLMLPEFMDTDAKLRRVWQVIKLMGLEKAADTICGDGGVEVEGGISGGQRRRVSVATQLLRLPACLLLDEPTSGLDATNALLLVKSLHTLAHRGGTNVIMTIHQPRKEIYRYLDSLKILVGGRILFAGAPKDAFDHFEVSRRLNIGDEVLDQLAKSRLDSILAYQNKYEKGPLGRAVEQEMSQELMADFDTELAAQLKFTLTTNALADGRWSWTESSSAPLLMYVLLSRTIKRGGFDIMKTITMSLMGGLLVGIVFLGSKDSYARHVSMSYLCVATMTFLQGTFIGDRYWAEKFMYTYESEAGTARPWISFLASMFSRLMVSSTVEALAFAVPVFYLGRMNNDGLRFLNYLLIMVMLAVATSFQYLSVEVYFMKPDDKRTGALVNIALLSLAALFNGFIIQIKDLPIYLSWVPYVMVSYWGFVGVLINDLKGYNIPCTASILECAARTGDAVVKALQYDRRDIAQCLFALLLMTGVSIFLCCVFFYFRWAYPLGSGLKKKTSPEMRADEEAFRAKARDLDRTDGNVTGIDNTLNTVLKDGKKMLQRANSNEGLKRNNSAGELIRSNSIGSNSSFREGSTKSKMADPTNLESSSGNSFYGINPMKLDEMIPDQIEAQEDDYQLPRFCCAHDALLILPFLSRMILLAYFILDFLASSTICIGQDAEDVDISSGAASLRNLTGILQDIGSSFSAINPQDSNVVFIGITAAFLFGYTLQYLIQLIFLFPRDTDNRIRPCTRVALLDILGAGFLAIDYVLLFILIGAGKGAALQLYILVAVRVIRFLRVASFWYKISAFHELRVVAYLEYKLMLMQEYDPAAFGENEGNDVGDNLPDEKPTLPNKSTKMSLQSFVPADGGAAAAAAAGGAGVGGRFRNMIQSVRVGFTPAEAAVSTESRRASLQKRVSVAQRRVSLLRTSQTQAPPAVGGLSRPTPPVAPTPPSTMIARPGGPAGPPIPPVLPRFAGGAAGPTLPQSMRIQAPGQGGGGAGFRMSMRTSTRGPSGGTVPIIPPRPGGTASFFNQGVGGSAPPIPPRLNASLQGFGLTPNAMNMLQGQRPPIRNNPGAIKPRYEPSPDEI